MTKMGMKPFLYGLKVTTVFDGEGLLGPAILDIDDTDIRSEASSTRSLRAHAQYLASYTSRMPNTLRVDDWDINTHSRKVRGMICCHMSTCANESGIWR